MEELEQMQPVEEMPAETQPAEEVPVQEAPALRPLEEGEILDFVRQYPGVEPAKIPQSVWQAVRDGQPLSHAYGSHVMEQLRADNESLRREMEILRNNDRNRQASLGSMHSSGAGRAADGFLLGFDQA